MDSLFDTITGLPVHPLVVHAAVVLLPLAAAGVLALLVRPAWRERYGVLVLLGLAGGAVAAWIAEESGEALAARVGLPEEHGEWGERLPPLAFLLLLSVLAWHLIQRRRLGGRSVVGSVLAGLAGLLAVAVLGVTVLVGHSGAEAAWGDVPAPQPSLAGQATP